MRNLISLSTHDSIKDMFSTISSIKTENVFLCILNIVIKRGLSSKDQEKLLHLFGNILEDTLKELCA